VEELISMNCIPIINENDVVASPPDLDLDLAGVSECNNVIYTVIKLEFLVM